MCNHTSPGSPHPINKMPIQHLYLQDRLRPATRTAAATIGLHNQIISAQTVRNHLREAHLHARRPHQGLHLTAVRRCNQPTFDGVWHFEEVFSLRMNPGFHSTGQVVDSAYGIVWVSGLLMSTLWIEWPMVAMGLWYGQAYVMDNEHRCIYWWNFECTEIPWQDPEAHCCAIRPRPSPHVAAW